MEKENQRIALTKRLLQESLLHLLEKKDLDKITVTELCRDAGINRATFYRHYEIPRDVLIEIEKDLYRDLRKEVKLPTTQEEIKVSIGKLCAYMEQHLEILRLLVRCNSDRDFAMLINELYTEIWREVRGLQLLKNLDERDVKLLALYSAGGCYFLLRQWLLGDIGMTAEQMSAYLYGLLNKTDWVNFSTQLGILTSE